MACSALSHFALTLPPAVFRTGFVDGVIRPIAFCVKGNAEFFSHGFPICLSNVF